MRLSARVDYALRAMAELAAAGEPRTVEQLSAAQRLPNKYLESILGELRRGGLLRDVGPVGRLLRAGTTAPTRAGRAVLRAAAAAPEALAVAGAAGTSAALVALHGPERTADPALRAQLVELPSWSRGLRARAAGTRGAAATAGMHPAVVGGWYATGGGGLVGGGDSGGGGGDGGGGGC